MDLNLKDKVVIVTGGTSGIGEAIVHTFAKEGAIVTITDRNEGKGSVLEKELQSKGHKAIFIQAELLKEADCKKIIDETLNRFGKIDVLVNNAGINDGVSLDGSLDDFMNSIRKNLLHFFAMVKYAKPALIKSKGNIVNIGSKVANTGQGGTSGYAASKGGVQAMTREWAVDFLAHGVRVNEVIPAETWTPLYESWIKTFENPEEKLKEITKRIPLGQRMTTAEEIADTVVFVASDRASHVTGQHLYVDGGYTHLDRAIHN